MCFGATMFAHGQENNAIPWETSRKLTWKDFKGKPFKTAWAAATTASGISYSFTGQERGDGYELDFKVNAFFYPDKSWYQPKLCDDVVLRHEQLHFDISELYARKLRIKLDSTRFTKNVKEEVKVLYEQTLEELHRTQSQYDYETNYSRDQEQQLRWNKKIASALNAHW